MLDTPKLEEVVGLGDRCVFKTNQGEFVKYLFAEKGDDEAEGYQKSDFLREYFIGGVLMQSITKDHLVETKDGDYYPPSRYLKALENIPEDSKCKGNVNRAIQNGELIPYIVTKAFDADTVDLFTYLSGKKDVPLSGDHIRKIMFQLTWIVAYMQSKYGVQHNDIHEKNIMVRPAREKMDLVFQIEDSGDTFELSLEKGELEVFIFDFGASAVKPTVKYSTDKTRPWQNVSDVALQINNAPEVLFSNGVHGDKNSEGDLFMMGHVLLTLLAHGHDGFNVEDKRFGIHTRNLLGDDSKDVRSLGDDYNFTSLFVGAEHPVFKNDAGQPEKVVEKSKVIMVNLYAIGRAFGGLNKAKSVPTYAAPKIKTFLKLPIVQNYVTTYFKNKLSSIAKRSVEFGCYRFLRRLLDFEPSTRCEFGVNNQKYGAMGALFHPYFSAFYKGYGKPIDGQSYIIPRLVQPLEYQGGGKNNETRKFIKGKEDTFITQMTAKLNQAESDAADTKQRWDDAQSQQKKSTKKKTKEDAGTTDDQKEDIPAVVITPPPPSSEDKGKEEADIPVDNDEVDSSDSGVVDNPEDDEETSGGANDNNMPQGNVPDEYKESVEIILKQLDNPKQDVATLLSGTKSVVKQIWGRVKDLPRSDKERFLPLNVIREDMGKIKTGRVGKDQKTVGTYEFNYISTGDDETVLSNAAILAIGIYALYKENYNVITDLWEKYPKVGAPLSEYKQFVLDNMGDLFGNAQQQQQQVVVEAEKEEKPKEPETPAMEEEEEPKGVVVMEKEKVIVSGKTTYDQSTVVKLSSAKNAFWNKLKTPLDSNFEISPTEINALSENAKVFAESLGQIDETSKTAITTAFEKYDIFTEDGQLKYGFSYFEKGNLAWAGPAFTKPILFRTKEAPYKINPYENRRLLAIGLVGTLVFKHMINSVKAKSVQIVSQQFAQAQVKKLDAIFTKKIAKETTSFLKPSSQSYTQTKDVKEGSQTLEGKVPNDLAKIDAPITPFYEHYIVNDPITNESSYDIDAINTEIVPMFRQILGENWKELARDEHAFDLARKLRLHYDTEAFTDDEKTLGPNISYVGSRFDTQTRFFSVVDDFVHYIGGGFEDRHLSDNAKQNFAMFSLEEKLE